MDSFYLDNLLMCITVWGSSRLVKQPTKGNIIRANLCLLTLLLFVWLRPHTPLCGTSVPAHSNPALRPCGPLRYEPPPSFPKTETKPRCWA